MRTTTHPQYHRFKCILEMIRAGMDSGHLPNATDFCAQLEVSRPTVMRDIDFLRNEENAPIEYVPPRHGYRLADETWQLPPVQVSRSELFAFSVARKVLMAFRGTPMEMDMGVLLGKIADSLEGRVSVDLRSLTDHFSVIGEDYVKVDPQTWSAVAGHVDRQERMRIQYRKFDGDVRDYELEPYHLLAYHGNWYVLARSESKNLPATFALSRILNMEGTGRRFDVPVSFDVQKHIDRAFGIVRGENIFKVRLLFSPNVATYIRERVWHPSQEFVERRNGDVELRLETAGWKELVRWVLSWQPDVEVLAPKRLRERVEEKMRQALS